MPEVFMEEYNDLALLTHLPVRKKFKLPEGNKKDIFDDENKESISDEEKKIWVLIRNFAEQINFPVDKITGPCRKHEFAFARQVLIYFLMENTILTQTDVGKFFTDRHHSTVIHSVTVVKNILSKNRFVSLGELKTAQGYLNILNKLWNEL